MNKIQFRFRLIQLKYLPWTIFFNFHYFPFGIAVKFPMIFMARPRFINTGGAIKITGKISRGMILLGLPGNDLFSPKGDIMWDNRGGTVIFNGTFGINPGCGFRIMKGATLIFGNNVSIGQNAKIACYKKLSIGDNCLISWDVNIMDTDFHPFYNLKKKKISTFSKPIIIGKDCFIGSRTTILKGSFLPANSTVGTYSLLNMHYGTQKFSLIAGIPATVKYEGVTRLVNESIDEGEIEKMINEYDKSLK